MSGQAVKSSLPKLIELVRPLIIEQKANFQRKLMEHWCQEHKLLSFPTEAPRNVSSVGGEKSYVLLGSLAKLEKALARWAMNELVSRHNFIPVTVPNILHDHIIEKCGFPTKSIRSQIYKISGNNQNSLLDFKRSALANSKNQTHSCIAGTSEFALVSVHIGDTIPCEELPKRYCALSRCYRAETSGLGSEWGLYRVHYFNKVEMVGLTMPDKSSEMHEEFLGIQKDLFSQLDLQFKILDMPEDDLGESASKKYDIEAWLEGRKRFGEITSTSNCEDYQSSRLDIKYAKMTEEDNQLKIDSNFVHTVNGTAVSTIRTLIALIEQHQNEDGKVDIPKPLVPYMDGVKQIPTSEDAERLKDIDLYPFATAE